MNHTQSGAIAVGDPMSSARIQAEAEHALEHDIELLKDTEEGRHLLAKYTYSRSNRTIAEYIDGYLGLMALVDDSATDKSEDVFG